MRPRPEASSLRCWLSIPFLLYSAHGLSTPVWPFSHPSQCLVLITRDQLGATGTAVLASCKSSLSCSCSDSRMLLDPSPQPECPKHPLFQVAYFIAMRNTFTLQEASFKNAPDASSLMTTHKDSRWSIPSGRYLWGSPNVPGTGTQPGMTI